MSILDVSEGSEFAFGIYENIPNSFGEEKESFPYWFIAQTFAWNTSAHIHLSTNHVYNYISKNISDEFR